jgi:uncharacterized protein (DUF433 family)
MKARSQPFSVRLRPDLDARITAMAKRTRRSKASVLQNLADEGERMHRYPGIVFIGPEDRRQARLLGTAFDVWKVIDIHQDFGGDVAAILEAYQPGLTARHVDLALAYYREFHDEIDEKLRRRHRTIDELRREYPFADFTTIDD